MFPLSRVKVFIQIFIFLFDEHTQFIWTVDWIFLVFNFLSYVECLDTDPPDVLVAIFSHNTIYLTSPYFPFDVKKFFFNFI